METKKLHEFLETQKVLKEQIRELAQMIEKTDPMIYDAFDAFVTKGTEPDVSVEGYSCNTLMQEHGLSITGALLTLDWLLREPDEAKQAIKDGVK